MVDASENLSGEYHADVNSLIDENRLLRERVAELEDAVKAEREALESGTYALSGFVSDEDAHRVEERGAYWIKLHKSIGGAE